MRILTIAAAMLSGLALPSFAADWQTGEDKGLLVYDLQDGATHVKLVCDPEGVWSTPAYHVTPSEAGATLEGTTVEVKAGEKTLTAPLSGGSILGTDKAVWNELLPMLTTPGTVSFSAAGKVFTVEVSSEVATNCARK